MAHAMLLRVCQGGPDVTLKDWESMTNWYERHQHVILAGWTVEIGDRKYDRADIDRLVEKNTACGLEAGEHMMVIRELFARYHMNLRQQT